MIDARKPDWDYWVRQQQLPAWQCLALSLDAEPRSLGLDDFLVLRSVGSDLSMISAEDGPLLKDMCKRLRLMLQAMSDKSSEIAAASVDIDEVLNVDVFVSWAIAKRWKLPAPLKALATNVVSKPQQKSTKKAGPKKSKVASKSKPKSAKKPG